MPPMLHGTKSSVITVTPHLGEIKSLLIVHTQGLAG